jgi:hypothetical protein
VRSEMTEMDEMDHRVEHFPSDPLPLFSLERNSTQKTLHHRQVRIMNRAGPREGR